MNKKVAAALVALAVVAGVGAGYVVSLGRDSVDPRTSTPTSTASGTPTPPEPPATEPPADPDQDTELQQRNRNERTGPSWSPADLVGENGQPFELGYLRPGAFGSLEAGTNVNGAMVGGWIELDEAREQSCEGGPFYKWAGQWSEGMDVLVGDDQIIDYLGLSKSGPETAEGISVGNSYGALKATYGNKLSKPATMDYGQPGVFLEQSGRWLGFLFDASPESLNDGSRIIFIEASVNQRPGLLRDGC